MPLTPLERALLILDHERAEAERASRAAELEDERERLTSSFRAFFRKAWPVLESGPLTDEWYLDALCDHGQAIADREILALMVHLRPRMLKTTILDIMLGAFILARDPTRKLLCGAYSENRCDEDSRKTRALITSQWFQERWPRPLASDQSVKSRFALAAGGQRYSVIYGTQGTGDGGNYLFLGDPQNSRDMWSPTTLERDHSWFYDTWERRRDDGAESPMLITTQRLAVDDLCGRLRYDDPTRWQVLSLQTRKTLIQVVEYRRGEDVKRLPLIDTALSRDGRFKDPREVGELLSSRVDAAELATMEANRPSLYAAQEQEAPILASAEGARIAAFKRELHLRSFATRMGRSDLRSAVECALADGWKVGCGWDHGLEAHREIGQLAIWSERDREAWALGASSNPEMQTVVKDAILFRESILDPLGIPIRRMVQSRGDVGNMGKGTAGGSAGSINIALSQARYEDGPRKGELVLGFPIGTASKGATLAEQEIEINEGFGAGALYLDDSAALLAVALECWTGGEGYKDRVDAWRYVIWPILQQWRALQPGRSGFASR